MKIVDNVDFSKLSVKNFIVERVTTLPVAELTDEGRLLYATDTDKLFYGEHDSSLIPGSVSWVNVRLSRIDELDDVNYPSPPLAGQVLSFNSGTLKWEPTESTSGISVNNAGNNRLMTSGARPVDDISAHEDIVYDTFELKLSRDGLKTGDFPALRLNRTRNNTYPHQGNYLGVFSIGDEGESGVGFAMYGYASETWDIDKSGVEGFIHCPHKGGNYSEINFFRDGGIALRGDVSRPMFNPPGSMGPNVYLEGSSFGSYAVRKTADFIIGAEHHIFYCDGVTAITLPSFVDNIYREIKIVVLNNTNLTITADTGSVINGSGSTKVINGPISVTAHAVPWTDTGPKNWMIY